MKRWWIVSLIAGLSMLGVPGCGSDDDDGGKGGSSGSSGSSGNGGSGGGSGGSAGAATGGSAGSTSTGGSAGSAGSAGAGTGGSAGFAAAYPPGPYGSEVGDVVANYEFEGYVTYTADALANTKPFVATWTMDDLRKSGKPYAFLHVSQFT